jgi:hypothetical protein
MQIMKTIQIFVIFAAILLAGCKRSDSATTKAQQEGASEAAAPQPPPEVYREVKQEDNIRWNFKSHGVIVENGIAKSEGFHFYVTGDNGKQIEIALTSTTVEHGQIQTKDFGMLKWESNVSADKLFATESQIQKLRALEASQP